MAAVLRAVLGDRRMLLALLQRRQKCTSTSTRTVRSRHEPAGCRDEDAMVDPVRRWHFLCDG